MPSIAEEKTGTSPLPAVPQSGVLLSGNTLSGKDTIPLPVILPDCDQRATEGVLYSFGKRGIPVIALSPKPNPPAFSSRYVSHTYTCPPVEAEQALLHFLVNLPHKGVLLYTTDAFAAFVNKHAQALQEAGYLLHTPHPDNFASGFDKAALALAAQAAGVPVIPTIIVQTYDDLLSAWRELPKPIILKATRLAGGKFKRIHHEHELEAAYREMTQLIEAPGYKHLNSGLIAQEFIHYRYDEIYCCEAYYTQQKKPLGFLSIHKIRPNINRDGVAGGRLFAGETIEDPVMEAHTKTILDHLHWQGPAHLDWIYSQKYQSYLLCEINPRLPGFSNLLTKVHFEMAWYYYADVCGLPLPEVKFEKALYFEALRLPGDISSGLYCIAKGYLPLWPFIASYLRVFTFRYKVCLDVFYATDLRFTLRSWWEYVIYLLKRPFRFLNR